MRMWRTWPARTRAATLAGIGVIAVGMAVLGLTHRAPPAPEVVHGPARLYSSAANEGAGLAARPPKPRMQANATPSVTPPRIPARAPTHRVTPVRQPQVAAQKATVPPAHNAGAVSALAARFPVLAHEALAADPASGTEAQYFARLGNLLNGTPLPSENEIPANADHLARAQFDLDREDLSAPSLKSRRFQVPLQA